MSDQDDREQRRDERLEAEAKATEAARRQRLLQLSVGGVFLAIIIVVVIIVVAGSGGGDKGGESIEPERHRRGQHAADGDPAERHGVR